MGSLKLFLEISPRAFIYGKTSLAVKKLVFLSEYLCCAIYVAMHGKLFLVQNRTEGALNLLRSRNSNTNLFELCYIIFLEFIRMKRNETNARPTIFKIIDQLKRVDKVTIVNYKT